MTVRNATQPLLVSRPTIKDVNRGNDQPIYLIPELCGMTGLSDSMRYVNYISCCTFILLISLLLIKGIDLLIGSFWYFFLKNTFRKDFNLMKDVAAITRVGPDRRVESLLKFRKRLYGNEKVKKKKKKLNSLKII